MLYTKDEIQMIFLDHDRKAKRDRYFLMKIPLSCPIRFTEERYAYSTIWRYGRDNPHSENVGITRKILNSPFVKQVTGSFGQTSNVFEYFIMTETATIEFISLVEPTWEVIAESQTRRSNRERTLKNVTRRFQGLLDIESKLVNPKRNIHHQVESFRMLKDVTTDEMFSRPWICPLSSVKKLTFEAAAYLEGDMHLFFRINERQIASFSVFDLVPVRITEDMFARDTLNDLLADQGKSPEKKSRTWNIWNSPFMLDIEGEGNTFSYYRKERDRGCCEKLIITDDHWIQFIPHNDINWSIFSDMELPEIIPLLAGIEYKFYEEKRKKEEAEEIKKGP
jgi:hypothetical protein